MLDSINLVIADLDGTIIDSRWAFYLATKDWFESVELEPPTYSEVMNMVHRTSLDGVLSLLLPKEFRCLKFITKAAVYINNSYSTFYMPKYARPIDGAVECLIELKNRGLITAILTNATAEMLDASIELLNLDSMIDDSISANGVTKPKPHPSGAFQILEHLDVEPQKALLVGDSTTDVATAKAAGLVSVGVLSGVAKREDLENVGADLIVKSLSNLKNFLKNV